MTEPRVLFVDHVGALGGAELSLLDIATHFRQSGRVVLFDDGPFLSALREADVAAEVLAPPPAVHAVSRQGGLIGDLRALPGVVLHARRLARRARGYDVIYANSQKAMVVAGIAGALARKPVIWHLRDLMSEDHFSRVHRVAAATGGGLLARRVITNSNATREAYVGSGGRASRALTIHNGIDARPFSSPSAERTAALRRELGIGDAPLVGMFSRLAPWKGQHILLDALRAIPAAHALLVGDALFQDDRAFGAALRRQATALGLNERVHFLGFRRDVPDLLHAVDVVVHASTAPEPFGRVLVEGMLAGRPVIGTAAGGALEIIEDGQTGRLVAPGDVASLRVAIADLLAAPERADRLAEAGRREAQRRFSLTAMLCQIHAVLLDVVEARPVVAKPRPSRLGDLPAHAPARP